MKHSHRMGLQPLALAFLAAVLFGAATPVSKALLASVPPFQLAGLLYLGAAIGVAPLVVRSGKLSAPWRLELKSKLALLGSLSFGGVLAPVFLLFGLKIASGASVSMWLILEGVATALLGFFLFREHMGKRSWLGIAGAIAAAALLSSGSGSSGIVAGILVGLACLCWGLDNNLSSIIDGIPPAEITLWKGLVAGSINLSIGLLTAPFHATLVITGLSVLVGVVSYGLSLVFYLSAAQRLGATRSQALFASAPFVGVVLSAIFLHEGISAIQAVAALLFALSLIVLFRDKHGHQHKHEPLSHVHAHSHDDGHHNHVHEDGFKGRHTHPHEHEPVTHSHEHWPDLHHRHVH